jgi:threonyl-tRNA synthetase
MNLKIRDAQLQKVPYMLVVGDKEAEGDTVSVRTRAEENLGPMPLSQLLDRLGEDLASRR